MPDLQHVLIYHNNLNSTSLQREWGKLLGVFLFFFLAFDFCRFCVVIRFFHPRHNGQWPLTLKDFYTRSYPLHYFLILILEKEPVFPFSMLSAKHRNSGTIFIMSLVWRGPWLGNERRTSLLCVIFTCFVKYDDIWSYCLYLSKFLFLLLCKSGALFYVFFNNNVIINSPESLNLLSSRHLINLFKLLIVNC